MAKVKLIEHGIYNEIPVHYCKQCLSLKIKRVPGLSDAVYCDDCGCTEVEEANIEEWETLYKNKHGFKYLDNNY